MYTGDISTIWPLFGMSNQLLASSALIIVTTMLIRMGKARYAWVTAAPGIFMAFVTMYAGYLNVATIYLPGKKYLLASLATIVMVMMLVVIAGAFRRWNELLKVKERVQDIWGDSVIAPMEGEACVLPVNPEQTAQERRAAEKWG